MLATLLSALALAHAPAPSLDDNPAVDPAEAKHGKVYQWQAADGLSYEYRLPEDYDPALGANLTVVLHGNGLDHRWTFWNHPPDEFRPLDIVVSPDGTTAHSGTGANEFLQGRDDIARVKALLLELKETLNVRQTFLYGHSQGAFFVYWFAGAEPELVDGVVAHAGGVWIGTEAGKKGHRTAIGVLHGTEDHVPYGQGVGGRSFYEERKYPNVHLRTLFDWDHRPHWYQAAQVLAWCEGTTSDDPAQVLAAAEEFTDTKRPMGVDWSALYDVASRLATLEGADDAQRERGAELAEAVNALAEEHLEAIRKGAGKKGLKELTRGPWSGELVRFLEDFRGTPAWDELQKKDGRTLERIADVGADVRRDIYKAVEKGDARAVTLASKLLEEGYLDLGVARAIGEVEALADRSDVRVPRKALARFEELVDHWREGREKGFAAFDRRNKKARLPRP